MTVTEQSTSISAGATTAGADLEANTFAQPSRLPDRPGGLDISEQAQLQTEEPQEEKRKTRGKGRKTKNAVFPPGVNSGERAKWISEKAKTLLQMLREFEDIAGDLNVICFARDGLQGTVYQIAPPGISMDVVRAMMGNYHMGDLFDLETQQAKKRRVIQERLLTDGSAPEFAEAIPHLEQLKSLVIRMMDAAIPGRKHSELAYKSCHDLSRDSLRERLNRAGASWYPEDVPFRKPSNLRREQLQSIVKACLQNGAISAQKLAEIVQQKLHFDIRASMRCLQLFESFERSGEGSCLVGGTQAAPAAQAAPAVQAAAVPAGPSLDLARAMKAEAEKGYSDMQGNRMSFSTFAINALRQLETQSKAVEGDTSADGSSTITSELTLLNKDLTRRMESYPSLSKEDREMLLTQIVGLLHTLATPNTSGNA